MDVETGSVVFALLMLALALFRCPHAWELVDKTELPAPIEAWAKCGATTIHYTQQTILELLKKKVILVIRCPNCGTAKVFRES